MRYFIISLLMFVICIVCGCAKQQSTISRKSRPSAEEKLLTTRFEELQNWQMKDYQDLLAWLRKAPRQTAKIAYRAGPKGEGRASLTLAFYKNKGLIIQEDLPEGALISVDPKTGKSAKEVGHKSIIYRDSEGDSEIDAIKIEGIEMDPTSLMNDGFRQITNNTENDGMRNMWRAKVGTCISVLVRGGQYKDPNTGKSTLEIQLDGK